MLIIGDLGLSHVLAVEVRLDPSNPCYLFRVLVLQRNAVLFNFQMPMMSLALFKHCRISEVSNVPC